MASLHKNHHAANWSCAFTGPDGRRMLRSTKTADKKLAQRICIEWQEAADRARRHELTSVQCRSVLAELLAYSSGVTLVTHTVEGWTRSWVEGKAGSVSPATFAKYKQVTGDFLTHLGTRADKPLTAVTSSDIAKFRDGLRESGLSIQTCNIAQTIIGAVFRAALRQGILTHNPVSAIDPLKTRQSEGREAFSHEELARIVAVAEGDWRGLILCAARTGLRLMDSAQLTWGDVDVERGLLTVTTRKTDTKIVLPIHPDFLSWLSQQPSAIGKAPVFPSLAGVGTGGSGLSCQFRAIMQKAQITERVIQADGDKGRNRSSKSFHSLRHYFVSELAAHNVPADLRKTLVGDATDSMHAKYTHHQIESLRVAVAKLPSLLVEQEALG